MIADARSADPTLSMRELARRLGYTNPSFLSDVIKGRRRLKPELVDRIACVLDLDDKQVACLKKLLRRERNGHILTGVPTRDSILFLDKFRFIADWFHLAILEMLDLKGASSDPEEISKRSGRRVSRAIVELALERLQRLGLVRSINGRLEKVRADLFVGDEAPSEAIRRHHAQSLELAREALDKIPLERRDFRGTFIAIRRGDWSRLQGVLTAFHEELHELHAPGEADLVVQIASQAFPITEEGFR